MQANNAVAYARNRLKQELSPKLTYHNFRHTFFDVLPAVQRLARLSHINENDTQLLEVAAAFHDIGFVKQLQNHEAIGAEIARVILPDFDFIAEDISVITGMIRATRIPQSPKTTLEQIIADADLDLFGRSDFWFLNSTLRQEVTAYGQSMTDIDWYRGQLNFLQKHVYFTPAAQSLRNKQKIKHMAEMEQFLTQVILKQEKIT